MEPLTIEQFHAHCHFWQPRALSSGDSRPPHSGGLFSCHFLTHSHPPGRKITAVSTTPRFRLGDLNVEEQKPARLSVFSAMLLQRCPRCRQGRMFRGPVTMNDPCPICGMIFQREEGYFLGAMYFGYGLACAILIPLFFLVSFLLPTWNSTLVALVILVPYAFLTPMVFRYSRVLWIYLDRAVCPGEGSAGSYEKLRLEKEADKQPTPTNEPHP
jgi:uncharacterized protein (DUF983 family)